MLTRSRSRAAPEAAGEIARMERVSDTPRPTTAVETALNADPTHCSLSDVAAGIGVHTGRGGHPNRSLKSFSNLNKKMM